MSKQTFLFIHQNFPGQFVHVARELARQGHRVFAMREHGSELPGVTSVRYSPSKIAHPSGAKSIRDFEAKVAQGLACGDAMLKLCEQGLRPDVIVVHPSWGEALFCKDVWPHSKLIVFSEFYYSAEGADYGFDPEFAADSFAGRAHLRLRNSIHLHALAAADVIYTPTEWQHRQIPADFRHKAHIVFDGIDAEVVRPDPSALVALHRKGLTLKAGDEVITFVNRNLEPYRGFHVMMRALPRILRERPNAHCVFVGRDGVSYGSKPRNAPNWRTAMLAEVGGQLPPGRVHFVGALPYEDYLRLLQVSACHVYLTYPFVLSWSCIEAMSAGCPVVGSRTAPVEEVIKDGHNGLLFDFFDAGALADKVVSVLADPSKFVDLRQRARETVIARYDLRTCSLPRLLDLLLPKTDEESVGSL